MSVLASLCFLEWTPVNFGTCSHLAHIGEGVIDIATVVAVELLDRTHIGHEIAIDHTKI